jgi:hypothetical protein
LLYKVESKHVTSVVSGNLKDAALSLANGDRARPVPLARRPCAVTVATQFDFIVIHQK